jgi:cell division control protein 45
MGVKSLKKTFDNNKNNCNIFVLVNCGGCIDLIELLSPSDDTVFFVCDSHRPLDLCNVFSDSQVSCNFSKYIDFNILTLHQIILGTHPG